MLKLMEIIFYYLSVYLFIPNLFLPAKFKKVRSSLSALGLVAVAVVAKSPKWSAVNRLTDKLFPLTASSWFHLIKRLPCLFPVCEQ